jgi:hypothetical protein
MDFLRENPGRECFRSKCTIKRTKMVETVEIGMRSSKPLCKSINFVGLEI